MSTIAPASTPVETTTADGGAAARTKPDGEATANTPDSPTKYAIFKEDAVNPSPSKEDPVPSKEETVEAVEEGTPAISTDGPPPVVEAKPAPNRRARKRSRRLSFADEVDNGQLCEVSYHQNLHYAQMNETESKSGGSGNKKNGGGCCVIS